MFISETSSKQDLLDAIYSEWDLVDEFLKIDRDPELMSAAEIYPIVMAWIEAGDECHASA